MVRQWQNLFYAERYSHTNLGTLPRRSSGRADRGIPDFVKLAEALGCVGIRCESKEDVDGALEKAMSVDDAPVVIDFMVGQDAQVWPMVPAGTSNDEIMAARNVRPVWDDTEG